MTGHSPEDRTAAPYGAPSRWLKGGAWALGGRMVSGLLGLGHFALVSRILEPADFGVYSLVLSVVTLGALFGTCGLHQAVVRYVAESVGLGRYGRVRGVVGRVYLLALGGAAAVGALYVVTAPLFARLFSSPAAFSALTSWIVAWIAIVIAQRLVSETFRGLGDIRLATIFSGQRAVGGLVTGILAVAALVALWLAGGGGLRAVVSLSVLAGLLGALIAVPVLFRKLAALPADTGDGDSAGRAVSLADLAAMGWPVLVVNLMIFAFSRGDLWIVGALLSKEEVALYAAGARLVGFVALPLGIVNAVVPPLIAELNVQGRAAELEKALRTAATAAGLPASLVLIALFLFGSPVLGAVFGSFYRDALPVLILLSIGQLFNVWAGSCGVALLMTGHQRDNMKVALLVALIAVGVGVPATRGFGMVGMAAVIAGCTVLRNVFLVLYAKRRIGIWTQISLSPATFRTLLRKASSPW